MRKTKKDLEKRVEHLKNTVSDLQNAIRQLQCRLAKSCDDCTAKVNALRKENRTLSETVAGQNVTIQRLENEKIIRSGQIKGLESAISLFARGKNGN